MLADASQTADDAVTAPKHPKFDLDKEVKPSSLATKKTMDFDPELEPLLKENPRRFVIFPIQYPDMWAMYKKVRIAESRIFFYSFVHFP